MTLTNDSGPTLDIASAAPDPVAIFGLGFLGEGDEYCKPPWDAWVFRLRDELTTDQLVDELWVSEITQSEQEAALFLGDFGRHRGFDEADVRNLLEGASNR